ncbi:28S ribosomal protein S31, mitochondrial [Colossoma macropomum]|uniref:28S ribosomal protein S31, mitochondrial n=1 Tax=Colossoma macropomum TaxID=42526 RepID=UPI001864521D|nr:28S ribosomal protein S31, mitochondrial [Colossoma macropomum]
MYRRAILSLYQRRSALSLSQDPRLSPPPCKYLACVPVFRAAVQVSRRAFGSAGVQLCEKKEGATASPAEEIKKGEERTEELQKESKKRDAASKTEKELKDKLENKSDQEAETVQTENTVKAKAQSPDLRTETESDSDSDSDSDSEAVSQAGGKTEEKKITESAEQRKSTPESPEKAEDNEKTGKKGLLELLGAMKVEVTTKRKLKAPKIQRSGQDAPPRPGEMESTTSMFQQATSEAASQSETLSPELVAAASAAASTLPDSTQAKSELLRQLRKHEAISQEQRKGETHDIGNIIADMKVGRRLNGRPNARPANQIRFDEDGRGYTHDRGITGELDGVRRRKNPFFTKRLNIFPAIAEQETDTDLAAGPTLWDADLANQIVQVVNQRPRNGFEEMIQWTREGKLWQYPINNEAGMEEEASVPFHEHVFLERHLEDGFPQEGPIRHFMELVVTGLGKNPHLSVRQKLEHIAWFREYFQQKQDVLNEAETY